MQLTEQGRKKLTTLLKININTQQSQKARQGMHIVQLQYRLHK